MNKALKNTVLSAFFIAIGFTLPFLTGQIKEIGNMLLPMHLPVMLCGLICGKWYGLFVGAVLPLTRSFAFSMPVFYPTALSMAFELAAYGFIIGLIFETAKRKNILAVYRALIVSMLTGRAIWGIAQWILIGAAGGKFTAMAFVGGAFLYAIPGIIIQLVLVPSIAAALGRARILPLEYEKRRNTDKRLKIVIAPDSFKGSISAKEAALAIERGLFKANSNIETVIQPIADGGEGTLDALVSEKDRISVTVTGTDGRRVSAEYGHIGNTAVIEMASAAGLTLVEEKDRNAAAATTYGVGELILNALDRGYRGFLITVGGSGTNDGGCGMFSALGARFTDKNGNAFIPTGATLESIRDIDVSTLDCRLNNCKFLIATDVTNVLCGKTGATYVYGGQKGADDATLDKMERGMLSYSAILEKKCGKKVADTAGCGAGGGLASPLLAFCNAEIRSGIEAVLDTVNFSTLLEGADAVITGEGRLDSQSLYGKAVSGVANAAISKNIPVYCFVGKLDASAVELKKLGISGAYATSDIAPSTEYSIAHADELLERLAEDFLKANATSF